MSRSIFHDHVIDEDGSPLSGASVNVYQLGTSTPITQTIYSASTGVGALANPFTTSSDGEILFYLEYPERVSITVTKAGKENQSFDAVVGYGLLHNRGTWTTATAYLEGAFVKASNGNVYSATASHTSGASTEPGIGASWATVWTLLVESGSDGAISGLREAGTDKTSRGHINFLAGFDLTDDSGNDETEVALDLTEKDHNDLANRTAASAHPATAVSFAPAGTIAATTVQAAIEEVASEAAGSTNRLVFPGFGVKMNAATTNVQMARAIAEAGGTSTPELVPVVVVRAGSITGISVALSEARTAETATFEVFKNGVATGLTVVIDGTNTQYTFATQAAGTDTFVAGDRLDVRVTTHASFTPTSSDAEAVIEVAYS